MDDFFQAIDISIANARVKSSFDRLAAGHPAPGVDGDDRDSSRNRITFQLTDGLKGTRHLGIHDDQDGFQFFDLFGHVGGSIGERRGCVENPFYDRLEHLLQCGQILDD